jgi:hypothetical protein
MKRSLAAIEQLVHVFTGEPASGSLHGKAGKIQSRVLRSDVLFRVGERFKTGGRLATVGKDERFPFRQPLENASRVTPKFQHGDRFHKLNFNLKFKEKQGYDLLPTAYL